MDPRKRVITKTVHDRDGRVTGGFARGIGIQIDWQNGPLEEGQLPNGAFVEGVLQTVLDRLLAYQETDLSCRENALAITKFQERMHWLEERRRARRGRGVQDTYEK